MFKYEKMKKLKNTGFIVLIVIVLIILLFFFTTGVILFKNDGNSTFSGRDLLFGSTYSYTYGYNTYVTTHTSTFHPSPLTVISFILTILSFFSLLFGSYLSTKDDRSLLFVSFIMHIITIAFLSLSFVLMLFIPLQVILSLKSSSYKGGILGVGYIFAALLSLLSAIYLAIPTVAIAKEKLFK